MVRLEDFHIDFDDERAVYSPGDEVTGSVVLQTNDHLFVDSVIVSFYGSARVFWVEQEVKGGVFRNVPYSSETIYFNEKLTLWRYQNAESDKSKEFQDEPKDPIDDEIDAELEAILKTSRGTRTIRIPTENDPHLNPGKHEFLFHFRLPRDLPSSFDASYSDGSIRYSVKVCLTSNHAITHSRKTYFTVISPMDLSLVGLNLPMLRQARKLCKNGLFKKGPEDCNIRLVGTMEKQGYVPGEPIFIHVDMTNQSAKPMRLFKVSLVQDILCYVDEPDVKSKRTTQVLCTISKEEKIRPGHRLDWDAGPLYVAGIAPTFTVDECMEVTYRVTVDAYRRRDYPKVGIDLPIVIGTIPVEPLVPKKAKPALDEPFLEPPPYYSNVVGIPPPSYEEIHGGMVERQIGKQEA